MARYFAFSAIFVLLAAFYASAGTIPSSLTGVTSSATCGGATISWNAVSAGLATDQVSSALDGSSAGNFGKAVASTPDGLFMAVGEPSGSTASNVQSGVVHLYTRKDAAWSLVKIIEPSSPSAGTMFGASLVFNTAYDGYQLIVGAPNYSGEDSEQGAVFAYTVNSNSATLEHTLVGTGADSHCGAALAFFPGTASFNTALPDSGPRLYIGCPGTSSTTGFVEYYDSDSGSFSNSSNTITVGATSGALYGSSLAVSDIGSYMMSFNQMVAIGAPGHDSNKGRVVIAQSSSASYAVETGNTFNGGSAGDMLGASVSAFMDGYIAIGAPGASTVSFLVFNNGNGLFESMDSNTVTIGVTNFGSVVQFGPSTIACQLAVGAVGDSSTPGKVFVYDCANAVTEVFDNLLKTVTAETPANDDGFGSAISFSTNNLYIGAPTASGGDGSVTANLPSITYKASCTAGSTTVDSDVVPFDATTVSLTGLMGGIAYTCKITTKIGRSGSFNTFDTTLSSAITPTGATLKSLTSTNNADGSIKLTWAVDKSSGATPSYSIAATSGPLSTTPASVAAGTFTYDVPTTDLTDLTAYTFNIKVTTSCGTSDAETFSDVTYYAPIPDTTVTATAGCGSATVSWTDPGVADVSYVASCVDGDNNEVSASSVTALTADVTGLTEGGSYKCKVSMTRASVQTQDSSYTSTFTVKGKATLKDLAVAVDPAVGMTLSWALDFAGGAGDVTKTISADTGDLATTPVTADAETSSKLIAKAGLTTSTTYTFKIKTSNTCGESAYVDFPAKLFPAELPAFSAAPTVTAGCGSATVSWSTLGDGVSYVASCTDGDNTVSASSVTALTATVSGLDASKSYTCKVTATLGDQTKVSDASSSFTPKAKGAVSGATASSVSGEGIKLTWTLDSDGGATPVTYSLSADVDPWKTTPVAVTGADATAKAYTVAAADLTADNSYVFKIAAVNECGTSDYVSFASTKYTVAGSVTEATLPTPASTLAKVNSESITNSVDCSSLSVGFTPLSLADDIAQDWFETAADAAKVGPIAISANGKRMIVGMPGANSDAGAVAIYDRVYDYAAEWKFSTTLDQGSAGDKVGFSVAISDDGSVVAYGAPFANSGSGDASVYRKTSNGWSGSSLALNGFTTPTPNANERYGYSVALSGDGSRLVISAPQSTATPARLFYVAVPSNFASGPPSIVAFGGTFAANLRAGISLSMSADGNTLVAGFVTGTTGSVRVYSYSGSTFSNTADATISDEATDADGFGSAVTISKDGKRIAIGAPSYTGGGAVYAYDYASSTATYVGKRLTSLHATASGAFGASLSFNSDGSLLLVGASADAKTSNTAGGAYVFTMTEGGWVQNLALFPSVDTAGLAYGSSVAWATNDANMIAVAATDKLYHHGRMLKHRLTCTADNSTLQTGWFSYLGAGSSYKWTTGLTAAAYSCSVEASATSAGTAITSTSNAVTTAAVKSAPVLSGLTASQNYKTGITLSWTVAGGADSYKISSDNGPWSSTPVTDVTASPYVADKIKLNNMEDYTFKIEATNTCGVAAYTNFPKVTWNANPPAIVVPPTYGVCTTDCSQAFTVDAPTVDGVGCGYVDLSFTPLGHDVTSQLRHSTLADGAGRSVAISADDSTMVVGGYSSLAVYTRSDDYYKEWTAQSLSSPNVDSGLGSSVAISADGSIVAAGAALASFSEDIFFNGAVVVWKRSEDGSYEQVFSYNDSPEVGDYCGTSVALSADGKVLVVGCPQDFNQDLPGHVRTFMRGEDGQYTAVGTALLTGTNKAEFGYSVAITGNAEAGYFLAVGAPNAGATDADNGLGAVTQYKWGSTSWTLLKTVSNLVADGGKAGDRYGSNLAFSPDRLMLVVAMKDNVQVNTWYDDNEGMTYWRYQSTIAAPAADSTFGSAFAFASNTMLYIGASSAPLSDNPASVGAVYKYTLSASTWSVHDTIYSTAPKDNGRFGTSVAVSASTLLIGAPSEANAVVHQWTPDVEYDVWCQNESFTLPISFNAYAKGKASYGKGALSASEYSCTVKAIVGSHGSTKVEKTSSEVKVTPHGAPAAPDSLSASLIAEEGGVKLQWTIPSSGDQPTSYELSADGGDLKESPVNVTDASTKEYSVLAEALTKDTEYVFSIRSSNQCGASSKFSASSIKFAPAPVVEPSSTAEAGSSDPSSTAENPTSDESSSTGSENPSTDDSSSTGSENPATDDSSSTGSENPTTDESSSTAENPSSDDSSSTAENPSSNDSSSTSETPAASSSTVASSSPAASSSTASSSPASSSSAVSSSSAASSSAASSSAASSSSSAGVSSSTGASSSTAASSSSSPAVSSTSSAQAPLPDNAVRVVRIRVQVRFNDTSAVQVLTKFANQLGYGKESLSLLYLEVPNSAKVVVSRALTEMYTPSGAGATILYARVVVKKSSTADAFTLATNLANALNDMSGVLRADPYLAPVLAGQAVVEDTQYYLCGDGDLSTLPDCSDHQSPASTVAFSVSTLLAMLFAALVTYMAY